MVRQHRLITEVRSASGCFSACVLIFQSGVRRIAHTGAAFMLHPVSINVKGVDVDDQWSTNRFRGMLMMYGMRVGVKGFDGGDTYFNAESALSYGIATELAK